MGREFFVPVRTLIGVFLPTAFTTSGAYMRQLMIELRDCLKTFSIFVTSQCFIARIVCKLFSYNRGISHFI